jgi:malonyl-CoA/methylmalonyl-CoA synthetase
MRKGEAHGSGIPILERAASHGDRPAVVDAAGTISYRDLVQAATKVAARLLGARTDLAEARVAFCMPSGSSYVAVQWGVWCAGGIAVPLFPGHPLPEIEYGLREAGAEALVAHPDHEARLRPVADRLRIFLVSYAEALRGRPDRPLPQVGLDRRAMILFTSGTTSRPKGVVLTHRNITAQIASLVDAWAWEPADRILHVLPLHHTHGIINALCCALWSGAVCEMMPKFDAGRVWDRFARGGITLFMAVPTIYVKLIAAWKEADPDRRRLLSRGCARMRLMVSGSAALPVDVFDEWRAVSGHALLERYGMTEIGMALSNPLRGERRPGFVGLPLPGVRVRLAGEEGRAVEGEGEAGEIEVEGPGVFLEYWSRPEATRAAFREGWFRTGDIAVREKGYYRILGRSSVDIIKTGGYKVSALEIEEALRAHPKIRDCAVVGIEDPAWGERVAAAVTLRPGCSLSLRELRAWAGERLAPYKIPTLLRSFEDLPRNALGKVIKPDLRKQIVSGKGNQEQGD